MIELQKDVLPSLELDVLSATVNLMELRILRQIVLAGRQLNMNTKKADPATESAPPNTHADNIKTYIACPYGCVCKSLRETKL